MDIHKLRVSSTNRNGHLYCELDSHADTCVAGSNFVLLEDPHKHVTVHPYSDEYKPIDNVPIATVGTVWVSPKDGRPYLLIVNEALYFGERLKHSLLCPNQMRAYGVDVNDCPRQFDKRSTHSIEVKEHGLSIPLELLGIASAFPTHKPSDKEVDELTRITLTSAKDWHPSSNEYSQAEARLAQNGPRISGLSTYADHSLYTKYALGRRVMAARTLRHSTDEAMSFADDQSEDLYTRLVAQVHVASDDIHGDGLAGHNDADVYPERHRVLSALTSEERSSTVTPEILSRRWGIGLSTAKQTLRVTTQAGIRNVLAPAERKVRKKSPWLMFPTLRGQYYADEMFSTAKSIRGHKGASVYTNGAGFDHCYPWKRKAHAPETLMSFIHDCGIPHTLVTDGAKEEILGRAKETMETYRIKHRITVPYSPWQNLAESAIRELKNAIRRHSRRTRSPRRLWCLLGQWAAAIRRLTALGIASLEGRTPTEAVMGSTPDVSTYAMFDWYQYVYYWTPTAQFPFQKKELGRWVGVAENYTDVYSYYILKANGELVIRKSVWSLSQDEMQQPDIQAQLKQLDAGINQSIGDGLDDDAVAPGVAEQHPNPPDDLFDDEGEDVVAPFEEPPNDPDTEEYTPEALDEYLHAEVMLPHGGDLLKAKVIGRKHDADGRPIGVRNANPILDSRLFDVEFPDGSTDSFTANQIAENLYSQVDEEGRTFQVLGDIVDHKKGTTAVSLDEGYVITRTGTKRRRHTTAGWQLQVEWKDGSTSWVHLRDLKDSNPVELAEYAVANKISEEPAFAWWVRDVLRRRDRIIKKVKSRYWSRTHKFGIELPKSVAEALEIDRRTGTDFWAKAIGKEMRNVMVAFEFRDDDVVPIGYKHIDCHMIFEIKMDLTRKARFVAGGHQTDPPKESTYSSVVSRDSVRIAFVIAALNDLDVLSADIQNAYLNAPTKERCYTTAGLEFGKAKQGRPVIIVRALYGLKSSGARFRDHMAATLREAGYDSCLADPDVWMRANTRPDGFKYWEYVLCYVDDVLVISHEPQKVMDTLSRTYTLKEGTVKEPDQYLGAEVRKIQIADSDDPTKTRWGMSSDLYIKRAIADVERELTNVGRYLKAKAKTPLMTGYRPELDASPELDARRANYFQGLIGVLRWIVELGRIDILVAVSMLSSYLACPRVGHLEGVFHVFAYLKTYCKSTLVFDETEPVFDESRFTECDWSEYYPGASEPEPPRAPELRGNSVTTTCFVDADHAGCRVTRRSQSGIIIFLQRTPTLWYSKRQNTVESSTFGSEFVAMKIAIEQIEALRYKLRMLGIPVDGPTNTFCDNESVFKNSTRPESVLKKKHNAIAYHRTREAQAAGILRIAWESGKFNIADILTKLLPGPKLRELIGQVLW